MIVTDFRNNPELDKRNEDYQFGFEDCGICLITKQQFDFNELEKHPETGYASEIIPQKTRLQFSESLR